MTASTNRRITPRRASMFIFIRAPHSAKICAFLQARPRNTVLQLRRAAVRTKKARARDHNADQLRLSVSFFASNSMPPRNLNMKL